MGDLIDTLDVDVDPVDADTVHVQATFGLVTYDGETAEWVCHEAVTEPGIQSPPRYVQGSDGRFVAWNSTPGYGRDDEPVWASDDRCTWVPVLGLEGRRIPEVSMRGRLAWAATADAEGGNGVFREQDGTFVPTGLQTDELVLSVRADGPAVWALTTRGDELSLWHSPDGEVFTEHPLVAPAELARPLRGAIADVDPEDGDRAWVVVDPIGADQLFAISAAGAVAEPIWVPDDRITDLERHPDGTLTGVLNDRRPWRSDGDGFVELTGMHDSSGVGVGPAGTAWFSHRSFVDDRFLSRSDDGRTPTETWSPELITRARECPEGTDQAVVCAPLWEGLAPRLVVLQDSGLPPVVEPEVPAGCGCRSARSGWAPSSLVGLLGVLRRRR